MANFKHILEGWGKSMGWLEIDAATAALSKERLAVCTTCPFAKESTILKLFKGDGKDIDIIYCTACGCPATEKSLVNEEKCPHDKWKN